MASRGLLLLQFTDPAVANEIIERHVVFEGGLLPAAKFIRSPPQCFNCQQVGHIARHCKSGTICGLCAEGHDTRQCGTAQKDYPIDQITPLNCAGCRGPHAASDKNCPIWRAAVYQHWCNIVDKGCYFPVMPSTQHARQAGSPSRPDMYRETK